MAAELDRRTVFAFLAGAVGSAAGIWWLLPQADPVGDDEDEDLARLLALAKAPLPELLPMAGDLVRAAFRNPTEDRLIPIFERLARHVRGRHDQEGRRIAQFVTLGLHALGRNEGLESLTKTRESH